jgi:hypothetical protein
LPADLPGFADVTARSLAALQRKFGENDPRFAVFQARHARVWFGGIETEADDLARMLLVEFATIYVNDWFITPVDLDAGTLARIEALVVIDTFGQQTLIRASEVAPPGTGRTPWRMFRNTGAPPDVLFVPPVLAHSLQGPDADTFAVAATPRPKKLGSAVYSCEIYGFPR